MSPKKFNIHWSHAEYAFLTKRAKIFLVHTEDPTLCTFWTWKKLRDTKFTYHIVKNCVSAGSSFLKVGDLQSYRQKE